MLNVRKQNLLLDRDEAMLYRVETKCLNEAVKYNQNNSWKVLLWSWMIKNFRF